MGQEQNLPQNPPTQDDLLETLLAGAAERAAQKQMEEIAHKGTVTKAEFSTALGEFENRLLGRIDEVFAQKATPAESVEPETEQPEQVQKAGSGRRSTVQGTSDPRSDNPVRYLIQKGQKGEAFDDLDKSLMWELTRKGLSQGMSTIEIDGKDFADEYDRI